MEKKDLLQTILTWMRSAPVWVKILLPLLVAIIAALYLLTSCGSTVRATVTNRAEGVTTTVSVTTNNPSSVTVNPDTDVQFNKK